jgi:hemin uptake protein HemP
MDKIFFAPTAPVEPNRNAIRIPQPRLHSKELFENAHEIAIDHAGEEYRLRLTRQGKLIPTK